MTTPAEASTNASAARGDTEASRYTRPARGWLVRLIQRWTGIDAVAYWRSRHEGTLMLLKDTTISAQMQIEGGADTLNKLTAEYRKQSDELTRTRVQLKVEHGTRLMLQNFVAEIGQQRDDMPKTTLGVIRTACVEAFALAESWIATGVADAAEIVNVRATLANRLLPDPKPGTTDKAADISSIHTIRKRDGRAGDTTVRPRPDQLHRYEYDLFGPQTSANYHGMSCNLCHKLMTDPIHLDVHVKTSGSITAEKRPDDTPPQSLAARRHIFEPGKTNTAVDHESGCVHQWRNGDLWETCSRSEDDPIHIRPQELAH